jgi:hypothetical protein
MNVRRNLLLLVTLAAAARPRLGATGGARELEQANIGSQRFVHRISPACSVRVASLVGAAGIGSRAGDQPVTQRKDNGTSNWRVGRRLH